MALEPRPRAARRVLAGRYRLLERIDEGGAGEVWRARDSKLDRDVAVKVLGPGADDAFRARFADEARRAAAVVHPNVVTVFDEGRDGADAFMVMELVPGKTARELVAERGPLPPHEVSRIVSQVAGALDAAHAAGVVHCDVKPANVIVDPRGIAKLTDFGIARAARDKDEQELLGTARYIAPERVEGGEVTAQTDVYGLGLLAYELLAGQPASPRRRIRQPPPAAGSHRTSWARSSATRSRCCAVPGTPRWRGMSVRDQAVRVPSSARTLRPERPSPRRGPRRCITSPGRTARRRGTSSGEADRRTDGRRSRAGDERGPLSGARRAERDVARRRGRRRG